jgi:hypothetical protein
MEAISRSAAMIKLAAAGFVTAISVVALTVSPALADRPAVPSGTPTLKLASQLGPSRGGAAGLSRGYVPLHAREYALAKAGANGKAGVGNGNGHPKPKPGAGAPTIFNPPNVAPSFDGINQSGVTPPDTTGAMGPDRYIEAINLKYGIYSRSGSLLNSGSLSALTGIAGGLFGYSLSDPQMMWDAKTGRFYYSAVYYDAFLSSNGLAVGWSKTANPSSASDFCQYAIDFGGELPDYPKLGDSSDFLLYGYNLFGFFASEYEGSAFVTLNKPPAGATCAPPSAFSVHDSGVLHNADGSLAATPVPANLVDDSSGAGYVVANADLTDLSAHPSGADFASVYAVTTSGTDANGLPVPSISAPTNVSVPSYAMPANAPEQGSPYLLDTLDGRFEAAVAASDPGHGGNIGLWTAHAVFGGAGTEERWYEIDPTAGTLFQSGAATNSSLFIWNGAISPDRANNGTTGSFGDSMAMSVSTSSASTFPALQFVWKKGANSQSPLTNLVQATGPNIDSSCSDTTACRWGDYSGASPDPAATGTAGTVWLANQYNFASGTSSDTDWRTWVFGVRSS